MPKQLPQLTRVPLEYRASQMERWKKGSYSLLKRSEASLFIKKILTSKATIRAEGHALRGGSSDRRFFGEAFVAAKLPHTDGWFGSYKWLTRKKWLLESNDADSTFQRQLRAALHQHIGALALERAQSKRNCVKRCLA